MATKLASNRPGADSADFFSDTDAVAGRYKVWLVDLDGTLYRAGPLRIAMAAELMFTGWPAVRVVRAFRRQQERMRHKPGICDNSPWEDQIGQTARLLKLETNHVEAVVRTWMFRRPGKWLRWCRRKSLIDQIAAHRSGGGRTALVSDYPAQEKLRALGLAGLFDVVVANGEPGGPRRLKPWPDGYVLAADRTGHAAAECLVLGDRAETDGEAARRAGMAFRKIG